MKHALKFASDLGLFSLALALGSALIAVFAYAVWERRAKPKGLLVLLLIGLPFVLAPGALFAFGAFGGMHERYGWGGVAALGALFGALLAVLLVPFEFKPREKAPPAPPAHVSWLSAAFGPCITAAAYLLAQAGVALPGLDRKQLGLVLGMEFLVLHSVAFLGAVLGVRLGNWRAEVLRWYVAACLLAFYLSFAYRHSPDAALLFLLAAYGTYGGLIGRTRAPDALAQVAKRWALGLALFMGLAIAFRMPQMVDHWHRDPHVLYLGLIYFLGLAVAEASGVYERRWLPRGALARRGA